MKGTIFKNRIKCLLAVSAIMVCTLMLCSCNSSTDIISTPEGIVGTWTSEDGTEVLMFNSDGSCSVPFTYDGGWLEGCDRYTITDGTLVLSSSRGNIRARTYEKCDSISNVTTEEYHYSSKDVIETYYLSGDTLSINGTVYKR